LWRGGTTITAGLPPPTHTVNIPQLYRRGKLPVHRLMSDHLKLDDINLGFDRLHKGKAVRQVVVV
jgi:alcohol dehydrogenase